MHDPARVCGPDVPACEPLVPGPANAGVDAGAAGAAALGLARAQDLPATDRLLRAAGGGGAHRRAWARLRGRTGALAARRHARAGPGRQLSLASVGIEALAAEVGKRVARRLAPRMQRVINLTGTVIHTNLGRALLADSALQHLLALMAGPNNLEYDLASGGRGDRDSMVEELLCTLTGAEAATVVNNNAAAVLLTIAALARGVRSSSRAVNWSRSAAPSACPT
jgi:L-seryl-tRNA(Ser) seleniumtransferase